MVSETDLMKRITSDPSIFHGKPIIRGRRMAVEHILSMFAAGETEAEILDSYPFLEPDDIRACHLYAYKLAAHERVDPIPTGSAA